MVVQAPPAATVAKVPTKPDEQSTVVAPDAGAPINPATIPAPSQEVVSELAPSAPAAVDLPDVPKAAASPDIVPAPEILATESTATGPDADRTPLPVPEVQTAMPAPADAPANAVASVAVPNAAETAPNDAARAVEGLPKNTAPDAAPNADQSMPAPAPQAAQSATDTATLAPSAPEKMPAAEAAPPVVENTPAQSVPEAAPASEQVTAQDPPVLRPSPGFGNKVDGVKTGRLPSIGVAPAADTGAEPLAPAADTVVADGTDLAPIARFARPFENTEGKPVFAILLLDTGGPDIDREALAAIPFPVSFVIDPMLPDASTAAQIYRAAGQEVLMLASGIPAGAQASDLAVSFDAMDAALPEAVGVVDLEQGGFQGNRTLATQVLALIKDQGRGVFSWDRGLNAASQVARRDGVPSAVIFRTLDGGNEGAPIIRRYLDRAAFKAAQDGRVVVAGQTRPETVAALLEWAVEGRAATVAIAPATAVMTSQ